MYSPSLGGQAYFFNRAQSAPVQHASAPYRQKERGWYPHTGPPPRHLRGAGGLGAGALMSDL